VVSGCMGGTSLLVDERVWGIFVGGFKSILVACGTKNDEGSGGIAGVLIGG
jgi:hypothetical protein